MMLSTLKTPASGFIQQDEYDIILTIFMSEVNPELVRSTEEEKKRWLPGFAEVANKFLNSESAVTVIAKGDDSGKAEAHRLVGFRTNSFDCKLRTVRWDERSRQTLGDRVTLEWMQRLSPKDSQDGSLPRWGFISIGYANSNISVLAEELPNAVMEDQENWNNGKPAMEIVQLKCSVVQEDDDSDDLIVLDETTKMSARDITKLLLEAKNGKVDKHLTDDMVGFFQEGVGNFSRVSNAELGIKIPVSSAQSISF